MSRPPSKLDRRKDWLYCALIISWMASSIGRRRSSGRGDLFKQPRNNDCGGKDRGGGEDKDNFENEEAMNLDTFDV